MSKFRFSWRNLRKTALPRETWYYVAVLLCVLGGAMMREVNLLLLMAGMLAGPLLLSFHVVVAMLRGIEVRRDLPSSVGAGDLLVVTVIVTNPRKRLGCWAITVEDTIEGEGSPPLRPTTYFSFIPAGQSRETVYRARLPRRGLYAVGPIRISSRFPFGLVCRAEVRAETAPLVVSPRLGTLTQRWIARHRPAFEGSARRHLRHGRVEGEFHGVRPWRTGDTRRSIHWRSSARHGTLVVRQFEQPRDRDIAIFVDPWIPRNPSEDDLDSVELAVSFTATVLADLCRKGGSNITLSAAAEGHIQIGSASHGFLQEAIRSLATVRAAHEDRPVWGLMEVLERIEAGTEIVLVTTRPTDPSDAARFARLRDDPALRPHLSHIRVVETCAAPSQPRHALSQYFTCDGLTKH